MKTITTGLLTITCLFLLTNLSYSQVKIDQNKISYFAEYVYANCLDYTTSEHLAMYKENISKVEIISLSEKGESNFSSNLLSSVPLRNKCNHSLVHDSDKNFNAESFNPLKYMFNYHSSKDQYFRVDNTNYVIKINATK